MTQVKSKIFKGHLMHHRLEGAEHKFTYPVYFCRLDVDELPDLDKTVTVFGYNRWNLFSLYDRDYLERGPGTLREKVERQLERLGISGKPARIELVTCARYFGYAFNPVSFFYCYDADGTLSAVLAQVNNTFGETHLYALTDPVSETEEDIPPTKGKKPRVRFRSSKAFHVSPFFDRQGDYIFILSRDPDQVRISINLFKGKTPAILTNWEGTAEDFSTAKLLTAAIQFPLSVFLTLPRIHWHAARLYFEKKRPVFSKPAPEHPMTIRKASPGFRQKLARAVIYRFLKKIGRGSLILKNSDSEKTTFGGQSAGRTAVIHLHDPRFFWRLVRDSGIGLGESYMHGEWDSPDVTEVLHLLIENKTRLEANQPVFFKGFGDFINRLWHLARKNNLRNSRKNIQAHYDLGNDFFKLFLDPGMTYSSALFESDREPLAQAQERKIRRMIEKAQIRENHHVLEIGSGWGSFAVQAARQTGCRVTGITLSREQLKYAQARAAEEGLQDRIDFQLCDYRKMRGSFDRIVSIEMLEAVGHDYYEDFFAACRHLLKPDGRAAIQVIAIPHARYDSYRRGCDFIQKHIFPGGHLPSREILCEKASAGGQFRMIEVEDIGPHYAQTLRLWREAFIAQARNIEELRLPRSAQRAWQYYFHYCEAGFASGYLHNWQFVLIPDTLQSSLKNEEKTYGSDRSSAFAARS